MATFPDVPQIYTLPLAENQQMSFYFNPPISNGSPDITSYVLTMSNQATSAVLTSNVSPSQLPYYTVTGLTNGQTYTSYVQASNVNGLGPAAYFQEFQTGGTVPGPVASATAQTAGLSNALVSWTSPTSLPDSTIFWYTITSSSTNSNDTVISRTANGLTDSNIFITGLNGDSSYTFNIQPVTCPYYGPSVTTNQIAFYSSGNAKLATRIGTASTSSSSYRYTTIRPDSSGNVYVLIFMGDNAIQYIYNYTSAPVGAGEVTTTLYGSIQKSEGSRTSCLVKYNSQGQAQWATIVPRNEETSYVNESPDIVCDASGNVYVVGNYVFGTTIAFNHAATPATVGGTITPILFGNLASQGNSPYKSGYIAQYNSSGQVQWVTRIGATNGFLFSPNIAVDNNNNLYYTAIVGNNINTQLTFNNWTSVTSNTINVTSWGTYTFPLGFNQIIMKLTTSGVNRGSIQWISAVFNYRGNAQTTSAIAVDSQNNIYITGQGVAQTYTITNPNTTGGAGFSFTTYGTITLGGQGGLCVVKYDASGNPLLVNRIESITTTITQSRKYFMSTDSNNNLYIAFSVDGNGSIVIYNSAGGTSTTEYGRVTTNTYSTTILIKMNSSSACVWATIIRGNNNFVNKSYCDLQGNFYLGLQASNNITPANYQSAPSGSPLTFGVSNYGILTFSGGTGNTDMFIVKYNSSGTVSWGTRMGTSFADSIGGVQPDNLGNLWFSGIYGDGAFTINNYAGPPVPAGTGNVVLSNYGTLPDYSPTALNNIAIIKFAA